MARLHADLGLPTLPASPATPKGLGDHLLVAVAQGFLIEQGFRSVGLQPRRPGVTSAALTLLRGEVDRTPALLTTAVGSVRMSALRDAFPEDQAIESAVTRVVDVDPVVRFAPNIQIGKHNVPDVTTNTEAWHAHYGLIRSHTRMLIAGARPVAAMGPIPTSLAEVHGSLQPRTDGIAQDPGAVAAHLRTRYPEHAVARVLGLLPVSVVHRLLHATPSAHLLEG
jgi:hypothetical protein